MKGRRVVITGIGALTPLGNDVKTSWEKLKRGESGIGRITKFDTSTYSCKIAGEVKNFDPTDFVSKKYLKQMDICTIYGVAASKMAIEDSALDLNSVDRTRFGVIIGSGIGGLSSYEKHHTILLNKGNKKVSPFFIPICIIDITAGWVSIFHKLMGPNLGVVSACATSNHAIGLAYKLIKWGEADVMIAGGTEAAITELGVAGFENMRAITTRWNDEPQRGSRPFDAKRSGFVMGEGAGIVVLESLEHAMKRGAKIYAEVVGFAMSGDGYHITAPHPEGEGAHLAMKRALEEAEISTNDVDYINAHGTSTPYNDKVETLAIKKLFGERAYKIPVSSNKSMIGHLLGAAGGVETIFTALTIKEGFIPPTINYEEPDPECDLDYVPNEGRAQEVNIALNNSFGFGGHNTTLVLKKYEE